MWEWPKDMVFQGVKPALPGSLRILAVNRTPREHAFMNSTELLPILGLSMLILAGGIVSSFGANSLFRSRRGRALVRRWRWWGLAMYYLGVVGVVVVGLGWVLRTIVANLDSDALLDSPWFFVTFGVVMGLPFTLPAVTGIWREHREETARAARKKKPASRQDRLELAKDLERQLRE
jgi:ABC-type Fe3+ transport system permease subunit